MDDKTKELLERLNVQNVLVVGESGKKGSIFMKVPGRDYITELHHCLIFQKSFLGAELLQFTSNYSGTVITWDKDLKQILETGKMENGLKKENWKYFYKNGTLGMDVVFGNNEVITGGKFFQADGREETNYIKINGIKNNFLDDANIP